MQNNPFGDERAGGRRLRLKPYAPPARKVSTWQTALGVAGLASGLVSILFGTAFAALGWLSALPEKESYLRSLGTVLLVASFPLLILGAHFLDLSDQRRASRRRPARASSGGRCREDRRRRDGARGAVDCRPK